MRYFSTRDRDKKTVSSACAIRQGLAPDGGLYVPESFPHYPASGSADVTYQEMAEEILSLYLTDYSREEIRAAVAASYASCWPQAVVPVVPVGDVDVLELFHGPTCAFKDVALQLLPHLLAGAMKKSGDGKEAVILVATSGDTGKAALEGFKDVPGVRIIVFYPKDGVSLAQEKQMLSTTGKNVSVVKVIGNFDDCQSGVKKIFSDGELAERMAGNGLEFSSANSINIGRLLPQIVYYYEGYRQMVLSGRIKLGDEIRIVVPSGNFGNILAAYYAKRMGLPVAQLLAASNKNDVITETIEEGRYNRLRPFYKTTSPSMDVLVSSNFERFLFEMYDRDPAPLAADMAELSAKGAFSVAEPVRRRWSGFFKAGSADEESVLAAIGAVFREKGYLLDPHTAVGWRVLADQQDPLPSLLAATASPYKFTEAVLQALDHDPAGSESRRQALLEELSSSKTPAPLAGIDNLPLLHDRETDIAGMGTVVEEILGLKPA